MATAVIKTSYPRRRLFRVSEDLTVDICTNKIPQDKYGINALDRGHYDTVRKTDEVALDFRVELFNLLSYASFGPEEAWRRRRLSGGVWKVQRSPIQPRML